MSSRSAVPHRRTPLFCVISFRAFGLPVVCCGATRTPIEAKFSKSSKGLNRPALNSNQISNCWQLKGAYSSTFPVRGAQFGAVVRRPFDLWKYASCPCVESFLQRVVYLLAYVPNRSKDNSSQPLRPQFSELAEN